MLFKKMSRNSAETAFIVVKNVSGSTITAGYSGVFDVGGSVDGVRVSQADSADLQAYAGVADADIANGAFGLFQIYGYRETTYVHSSVGSSVAGDSLVPFAGEWGLNPVTTTVDKHFGFLCEAVAASGTSSQYNINAKCFIRAL